MGRFSLSIDLFFNEIFYSYVFIIDRNVAKVLQSDRNENLRVCRSVYREFSRHDNSQRQVPSRPEFFTCVEPRYIAITPVEPSSDRIQRNF